MATLHKYPRTPHLEGSGLQAGDEDVPVVAFEALRGRHLVVEEKLDGANSAISFDRDQRLLLQSRGHYLSGGPREAQFGWLKAWAGAHQAVLWDLLGDQLIAFGEYTYALHSIYYSELPHYWHIFDVLDRETGEFWDTPRRLAWFADAPFVVHVPVLHSGPLASLDALRALVGPSLYIGADHRERLRDLAFGRGLSPDQVLRQADPSGLAEGLYIKVEEDGIVTARYKYVRPSFLQTVLDAGDHWMNRPLLPNRLRAGVELF
jgi:hypothetical protein